ncbi:MAG: glycosyl hydrolase-related protein, partial [Candidatus Sumerlaeia bacterium]|nr:glycosyl hydrolase-related protein [Candidatus Sumerlaeia bacterium]
GDFSPVKTMRFCRESVINPVALFSPEWVTGSKRSINAVSGEFLRIEPANVLVTAFKKAEFGSSQDYIIRLKELSGSESQVKIMFQMPVFNATLCSLTEIPFDSSLSLPVNPVELKLSPFDTATVRLRFHKN